MPDQSSPTTGQEAADGDERTLYVVVESSDEYYQRSRRAVEAAESDGYSGVPETPPSVSFPDIDSALSMFGDATLELLRVIRTQEPASIRETARLVDRDKKNVHKRLRELETLDVIEFVDEGAAKRPVVTFDHIVFDVAVSLTPEEDAGNESALA